MNIALWIVQGLLALAFLLAGSMKAFAPMTTVKKNMPWANDVGVPFVRFIGVAELLGGIGLILPAITGIQSWLTIAAALGLVVVMVSASVFHASRREYQNIGMNVVLLLLAAFVVLGRWALAPL
jgi:putative oxidoreductase